MLKCSNQTGFFGGLILLSVGVHLIGLIHLARIYHPTVVSRIELTLQSIKSPPQHKVVAPPASLKQPSDVFKPQPPPPENHLKSPIAAPHFKPPEPILAERLQRSRSLPQLPDKSDPVVSVWEEAPEAEPATVAPAPPTKKQENDLVAIQYTDRIKQQIESAKEYPPRARRRNLEGVVKVLFTIGSRGNLESIRITLSSGSRILDRSAIKAVQKAAPFDAPPNGSMTIALPIKYQLTRS